MPLAQGAPAGGGRDRKVSWQLLALCYMGLIWFLSSRPGTAISLPGFTDKGAHLIEYAILGFFLGRGFGKGGVMLLSAWLLASAYGVLDEYHQSFVIGRFSSVWDAAADSVGAAAGVWFCRQAFSLKKGGAEN